MADFRFELPQPGTTTSLSGIADVLFDFSGTQVSSDFLREGSGANRMSINGTGFIWEFAGFSLLCVAGQINSLIFVSGGVRQLAVTGLEIDGPGAVTALNAGALDFLTYLTRGSDRFFGTSQQDSLDGGLGRDRMLGGAANDTLAGDQGGDSLFGGAGRDFIVGGTGNDRLFGGDVDADGNGANTLYGDNGNDFLTGGIGLDYMFGGDGNDTLVGARRFDALTGGAGADDFIFRSTANLTNNPFISDFQSGPDEILLDSDRFTALGAPGNLAPARYRFGTDATDSTDRIIYDQTNGRLWYDPDGVGGAGKKLIAIVYSGFPGPPFPALDPDDFRIIG